MESATGTNGATISFSTGFASAMLFDAAAAAYNRVVAERAQAEARAKRIALLVKDGSASQQDYDDARFTAQALAAAENTADAQRQSAQLCFVDRTNALRSVRHRPVPTPGPILPRAYEVGCP